MGHVTRETAAGLRRRDRRGAKGSGRIRCRFMSGSNSEMERVEASWKDLAELVDQLQDAGGLSRTGRDGWTVKDHLVHVGAWDHSLLGLIEGRNRLEAMGVHGQADQDTDAINEAVRKLHESDTADEALGYFRESHLLLTA